MYDKEMLQPILNLIRERKISTTEVTDCLNKTGALKGINPINRGHFSVGEIEYIYAHSDTNYPIHEQLRDAKKDCVIFIDATDVTDRALFGEIVSTFMFRSLNAVSVITTGFVRDAGELIELNYPIWCKGFNPEGCYNVYRDITPNIKMITEKRKRFYDGCIAVCDDCGVAIITKDNINQEMYNKLLQIEEQEKIWFDCVLNRGWNTFDTICLKKYKQE